MIEHCRATSLVVLAAVSLFGGTLMSVSATASAAAVSKTQSCQELKNGVTVCNVHKVASSDSLGSFHVTSITTIKVAGDTVLRYQTVNGYATSAKCYQATSFTDVSKGATCWVATKLGYRFKNSGVSSSGIRVYFEDYIGSKYSPVGTKFYWDEQLRTWRKANCGNYVSFIGTEKLTVARVELVQTFNQLAVLLTGEVQKTLSEEIGATASCNVGGTSAFASYNGTDILRLWIKVQARASSYESAIGQAEVSATKRSNSLDAGLSAEVKALAFDHLTGKVKVSCHTSVTKTTTTVKPKPPIPLVPVYVTKIMESPAPADRIISSIPNGTKFRFQVTVDGQAHVVLYQHAKQLLGRYPAGTTVKTRELKPLGSMQWILLAPATVVQTVKLSNQPSLIVYKDQEVAPLIPVYVTKIMESPAPADRIISSIPNGTKFRFLVMVKGHLPKYVLYNGPHQWVGDYAWGTTVYANELTPFGVDKWVTVSKGGNSQSMLITKKYTFEFTDREIAPPPPTTTTTVPPPPTTTTTVPPPPTTTTTVPPPPTTTTTVPPPPTTTTTQPPPPKTIQATLCPVQETDVDVSEQIQICAKIFATPGDDVVVTIEAMYGSFTPNAIFSESITAVAGVNEVYATYVAPPEVPVVKGVAQPETVTLIAQDVSVPAGLSAQNSITFPIQNQTFY
jgi:hypothetical protein